MERWSPGAAVFHFHGWRRAGDHGKADSDPGPAAMLEWPEHRAPDFLPAKAGGFSKFANPKQVVVVRNKNGKTERYALNLGDTLSGASSGSFYLRPYDTVYVKQSRW